METVAWVLVGIVVVALLALLLALAAIQRRTAALRRRFGPEYDRAVAEHGYERAAQEHLEDVARRRDAVRIRPLPAQSREQYLRRWRQVQGDFVDHPGTAVDEADDLVTEVMRERGYPGDDFASRADLMAAEHPEAAQAYRAAHDARRRHHDAPDGATTEELRRAMLHYRELVTLLVEDGRPPGSATGVPDPKIR